ncbi:MAG: hypothetical protein E6R05_01725 [Candidatus Moraniibacteriota bacterium]|nr:MAG: hypothetical protein E6R05_01725 [Candidatus Moranbacteria bacterium]
MNLKVKKTILSLLVIPSLVWVAISRPVFAATACGEAVPSDENSLQSYVDDCNSKLKTLSGQKQTLAQALGVLTTQINLTQAKIAKQSAELARLEIEITDLSGKIQSLDYSLTDLTKLFANRVRQSYITQFKSPYLNILMTNQLADFAKANTYLDSARNHDRNLLISLEKSRLDYDSQKTIKEKKQIEVAQVKKNLDLEKQALSSQVASKNKLLADTRNDEARYQSLLSQAQKQLSAFLRFTSSQGGASLLSNQTRCDGWGCYYNQRDSVWGNQTIGLSSESMKEVGCLVTSMAMVASHYGKNIKPGDIAGSSNPFWGNTAYMNQGSWSVGGTTMTRTRIGSSLTKIDEELAAGRPVVVGIYSGPDHFLVITKKDGNDYIMNDPFPESGNNLKFTSRYPLTSITAVDRVTVN